MKHLAIFILFMILTTMIKFTQNNKTKYNKKHLSNFLKELKLGGNQTELLKHISNLAKEKEENIKNENHKNNKESSFEVVHRRNIRTNKNDQVKKGIPHFRFAEKAAVRNSAQANELEHNTLHSKYLTSLPTQAEGWLRIKSNYFRNNSSYPPITVVTGIKKFVIDDDDNLINTAFRNPKRTTPQPTPLTLNKQYFYYRVNQDYLYLSPSKESSAIIFSLRTNLLKEVNNLNDLDFCILLKTRPLGEKEKPEFKLCTITRETTIILDCVLTKAWKNESNFEACKTKLGLNLSINTPKIVKRKIKQPLLVIPTPQRMCNQNWTYEKNGADWECGCADNKLQSPIDLPPPKQTVLSPVKPLFAYDYVNDSGPKLKVEHSKNSLRILANSELLKVRGFGKLVTHDGTVYLASEIIFRTPSEHTIDGKKFPLEIQVLHEAKSKGDFGKKAVLSFLYKAQPGVYNKFIDDVEFFNLPNPADCARVLYNKLYVPSMLFSHDDELSKSSIFKPFSFYTYEGSLSYPPCVENVIYFVASAPIGESPTALDLFKEALRQPDFEDQFGNIITSKESVLDSSRLTQPLNGRTVFFFDHMRFSPPLFETSTSEEDLIALERRNGHYEKQESEVTDYFFVESPEPSNVPGAVVVAEDEAK